MAHRYTSARNAAFHRQGGRCYYCDFPMWLTDRAGFAAAHGITLRQAGRLQATGEHLVAQQDGGRHEGNVVAACRHCNQTRHRFRPHNAPSSAHFLARVRSRVKHRHWHPPEMFDLLTHIG